MVMSDRRPSELVATFVAALARDDADPAKIVQDGTQEANREPLSLSELFCGEWLAAAGAPGYRALAVRTRFWLRCACGLPVAIGAAAVTGSRL